MIINTIKYLSTCDRRSHGTAWNEINSPVKFRAKRRDRRWKGKKPPRLDGLLYGPSSKVYALKGYKGNRIKVKNQENKKDPEYMYIEKKREEKNSTAN